MNRVRIPKEAAEGAGRAARDLSLAALLGGHLFGRFAMGAALEEVSDKTERGRVLNRAWRRYGMVNSLAIGVLVADRVWARRGETGRSRTGGDERAALAQDAVVGAVVVTGLASAAGGVGFAQQAPDGAVPMQSGHDPAPETPPRAARLKRAVNALGTRVRL